MKHRQLYLLYSCDHLKTAFFCGNADECAKVLGLNKTNTFYTMMNKNLKFLGFFRAEKVSVPED